MNIYIVGIEGAGTSALAQTYVAAGHRVSGSDDGDGFYRAQLEKIGVHIYPSFDTSHVPEDADLVVHSTAFDEKNIEIIEAHKRDITVQSYPQAIADLFNNAKQSVAVCGTHGKTTTTALTAYVLAECGKDPQAIVGSQIIGWQGNALTGQGDVMVLEADEYQNKLQYYQPQVVILTSVSYDHPDFFATPESYVQVFRDFVARIPENGLLVACGDDATVRDVLKSAKCHVITYGFDEENTVQISQYRTENEDGNFLSHFCLTGDDDMMMSSVAVPLSGKHNVLNATAAIIVAQYLKCDEENLIEGIAIFRGVKRRFEKYENYNGCVCIDDYAHHPDEVQATLAAARELYPQKKIIAAFHPHTFTRTKALLPQFAQAFGDADQVIILDIYGSAREKHGGITSQDVADAINEKHSDKAQNIHTIPELTTWAQEHLTDDDVFITLGAGDIWKTHDLMRT